MARTVGLDMAVLVTVSTASVLVSPKSTRHSELRVWSTTYALVVAASTATDRAREWYAPQYGGAHAATEAAVTGKTVPVLRGTARSSVAAEGVRAGGAAGAVAKTYGRCSIG